MKTIVITGAASGLGKAIAYFYNNTPYGNSSTHTWQIIVADINDDAGQLVVDEINNKGGDAYYFHCDVGKVEDFSALAAFTEQTTGQCNILINNAGIASSGSLMNSDEAEWERMISLDLMSCVRGSKAFIPLLKQSASSQSPNAIVNTASFAGIALMPRMMTYNVTKAAVIAFTQTLKAELLNDHIHVAVACPSFFKTNLTSSMIASSQKTIDRIETWMERSSLTAEIVAEDIATAIIKRETLIISHKNARRFIAVMGWVYRMMFKYTKI